MKQNRNNKTRMIDHSSAVHQKHQKRFEKKYTIKINQITESFNELTNAIVLNTEAMKNLEKSFNALKDIMISIERRRQSERIERIGQLWKHLHQDSVIYFVPAGRNVSVKFFLCDLWTCKAYSKHIKLGNFYISSIDVQTFKDQESA